MLIRAARYLGVKPWELEEQPMIWQTWAFEAQRIDLAMGGGGCPLMGLG